MFRISIITTNKQYTIYHKTQTTKLPLQPPNMSKPSFTSIFQQWASAKDAETYASFVSPTVRISYKGQQKDEGIDNLTRLFGQKATATDVQIQDLKELSDENAIDITMTQAGNPVHERYSFGEEAGQWRITAVDTDDNLWG